jgi:hypothetical protein
MSKKLLIVVFLLLCFNLVYGYKGDGLGNHKATKDLNMDEHDIINAGTVRANNFDGNFSTGVPHIIECKAGENLAKGEVVYKSGSVGTKMQVSKADFDDPTKDEAIGFAFETKNNGQDILVIMNGMLNDIDTSGRAVGSIYLWETGDYVGSAPSSGVVQNLGDLVIVNAVIGAIYVHIHPTFDYISAGIGEDVDIRMGDGGRIVYEDGQDNLLANMTPSSMTVIDDYTIDRKDISILNKSKTLVVGFTVNCDYICDGTDDEVQINAALLELKNNYSTGTVVLREGIYNAELIVTQAPNTTIEGMGNSTVLNLDAGTQLIEIQAGHINCKITNMAFTASGAGGGILVSASSATIQNCFFYDLTGNQPNITVADNMSGVQILGNRFIDFSHTTGRLISVEGDDCIIANNTINTTGIGIFSSDGLRGTIATNRIVASSVAVRLSDSDVDGWMIHGNNFQDSTEEMANDSGADTRIRNNVDINGAWLPETDNLDMGGNDLDNVYMVSVDTITSDNADHIEIMKPTTHYGSSYYRGHDIKDVDDIECNSFSGSPDGSNIVNLATAPCAGDSGIVRELITFFVPGDAYVTTGIAYFGPLGYGVTIASAMATVTADGTYPRGTGNLNFDIRMSSGIAQSTFESIFNSTYSLQMSSGTCWAETTDFREDSLKSNYVLRLDIGEVCGTDPGGDPICVSIWGTQD